MDSTKNFFDTIRLLLIKAITEAPDFTENLLNSGLFYTDSSIQSALQNDGGSGVKIPVWKNTLLDMQEPYAKANKDLTTKDLTSTSFTAVQFRYEMMHTVKDQDLEFANSRAGILEEVTRTTQNSITYNNLQLWLATLNGIMASSYMKTNATIDKSSTALPNNANGLLTTLSSAGRKVLGDKANQLKILVMHSAMAQQLINENDNTASGISMNSGISLTLSNYRGYTVIENDLIPYNATTNVGSIYMLGLGTFAVANGRNQNPVETIREGKQALTNSIVRVARLTHPLGFSFTKSDITGFYYPTKADLENGANWANVFDKKNMPYVHIKVKLPTDTVVAEPETP